MPETLWMYQRHVFDSFIIKLQQKTAPCLTHRDQQTIRILNELHPNVDFLSRVIFKGFSCYFVSFLRDVDVLFIVVFLYTSVFSREIKTIGRMFDISDLTVFHVIEADGKTCAFKMSRTA